MSVLLYGGLGMVCNSAAIVVSIIGNTYSSKDCNFGKKRKSRNSYLTTNQLRYA